MRLFDYFNALHDKYGKICFDADSKLILMFLVGHSDSIWNAAWHYHDNIKLYGKKRWL